MQLRGSEKKELQGLRINNQTVSYSIERASEDSKRKVLRIYAGKTYEFVNLWDYERTAASLSVSRDIRGGYDTLTPFLLKPSKEMIGWLNGRKVELIHPIPENGDIVIIWEPSTNELEWLMYFETDGDINIRTSDNYAEKYRLLSFQKYKQIR